MAARLAAVSVDLDEIDCYTAIHGIEAPSPAATHAVYERALPRLARLFDEEQVPATFFVIGRDLATDGNAERVSALHRSGHEIANHSMNHRYDLVRLGSEAMRQEIVGGSMTIERVTGARPRGFRAPGYTVTDELLHQLEEAEVEYDSSVFPCPSYYGAKSLAMSAIRLRGRRSHSILDHPRVLTAPADPYRVGRPYTRHGSGIRELPIAVTRDLSGRLPFIGTSIALAGAHGARILSALVAGRPLVNLELHGIDLCDAEEDGLGFLRPHQPDLRRSVRAKEAALRAAIRELKARDYEFQTLAEAAVRLLP